MSRAKKIAKADRRRQREQRAAASERALREVMERVDEVTCSTGAADVIGGWARLHREDVGADLEHAEAVLEIWKKRAPDHPLTATLDAVAEQYRRHDAAIAALCTQLEAHADRRLPEKHYHLDITRDDFLQVAKSLVGDELVGQLRLAEKLAERAHGHLSTEDGGR
jgi:hypothetical protein